MGRCALDRDMSRNNMRKLDFRIPVTLAVLLVASRPASAAVTEPDGQVVPIVNNAEDVATTVAYGRHSTLDLLFSSRGEMIDSRADASTTQTTFSPRCNFSGSLVLHGGACQMDFGWYNVDSSSSAMPSDDEIFVLVPRDANLSYFPLVGDSGLSTFSSDDILADPRYTGGLIGFAIKNSRQGACTETHASELRLSPVCDDGTKHCPGPDGTLPSAPWVVALSYQSTLSPNAYYVAFEDQPAGANDNDFNDDVFFITGVSCAGAGASCSTGEAGVCGVGVQQCAKDGALKCVATNVPAAEVCDGLDNDCNGLVDDGANLCAGGQLCDRGACVPRCDDGHCPAPLVCTAGGVCGEAACKDVSCDPGKRCAGGVCAPSCQGITCPAGQTCRGGACLDACLGIKCEDGFVCIDGACQQGCDCRGCPKGTTCGPGRRCIEDACKDVTCPAGSTCSAGACVDNCMGAVCPVGQSCHAGACVDDCAGVSCGAGQRCAGGACVDACAGVTCAGGQTCRSGACVDECNVTCAADKVCRGGSCVDRCDGVTCPAGQACRGGSCVDPCVGVTCSAAQKCVAGQCVGACLGVGCLPSQTCVAGVCRDSCQSDGQCPNGQACVEGRCLDSCGDAGVCAPGHACMNGACVLTVPDPSGGSKGNSGCSCSLEGDASAARGVGALGIAVAALLLARRRRARELSETRPS